MNLRASLSILSTTLAIAGCGLGLLPGSARAQGPFPPTAVPTTPMMKRLDQIEARTAIPASPAITLPYTITTSGSYYLTGNISGANGNAIVINAPDVTLDLNGFAISSSLVVGPASGTAISTGAAVRTLRVMNGGIRGGTNYSAGTFTFTSNSGFSAGITGSSGNITIRNVTISGIGGDGINLQNRNGSTVGDCDVHTVSGNGILAGRVTRCNVMNAGLDGINATLVTQCTSVSVSGTSIYYGIDGGLVADCRAVGRAGRGISAVNVDRCVAESTSSDGIYASANISHSSGISGGTNGFYGLRADGTVSFSIGSRSGGTGISSRVAFSNKGSVATTVDAFNAP